MADNKVEIWAVTATPFTAAGALDEAALLHNAAAMPALGVSGVFFNAFLGECFSLTYDERCRIVELVKEGGGAELQTAVCIDADNIPTIIQLGQHAKSCGADLVALTVPALGPCSPEQMGDYFAHIMRAVDMPLVLFNPLSGGPGRLTAETVRQLNRLPQLRIIKSPCSAPVNEALREAARPGVQVCDPSEERFFDNYQRSGQRMLFADPEPLLYQRPGYTPINAYANLLGQGRPGEAKSLRDSLAPQRAVYNKWIIDDYYRGNMPAAAFKAALDLLGTLRGGLPRPPLEPLSPEQLAQLRHDMEAAGMI